MFKKLEYAGFDQHPQLRAIAEQGTRILLGEVSPDLQDYVDVTWQAYPDAPAAVELDLSLVLPTGTGTARRLMPVGEFEDEGLLRSRCRAVWDRALGAYLEKRKSVWDELLREPAGA